MNFPRNLLCCAQQPTHTLFLIFCRVNGETASIWVRLPLWHEICILRFKMVNFARSLALACAITFAFLLWSDPKYHYISSEFPINTLSRFTDSVFISLLLKGIRPRRQSRWTEIYFSPCWEGQNDRFFLTQIPLLCDDFSMTQAVRKRFRVNTSKPRWFRCGFEIVKPYRHESVFV